MQNYVNNLQAFYYKIVSFVLNDLYIELKVLKGEKVFIWYSVYLFPVPFY